MQEHTIGKVILAGAGPGDPELISVKAARYLMKADVVLTDRLVSPEILVEFVKEGTDLVYVGKDGKCGDSTPQEQINQLMVEYALQGKLVVRLKGGDVSIFSNILDELQTLVENNIAYEIIPGISAALGAAAYTGIPLTARNQSLGVRFLTYYKPEAVHETYWKELAQTKDTLVFYMSSKTLDKLIYQLTSNGIDKDISVAVVEQATTKNQCVHISNIYQHKETFGEIEFVSPTLVIVGKVVDLHAQYGWLTNSKDRSSYFTESRDAFLLNTSLTSKEVLSFPA